METEKLINNLETIDKKLKNALIKLIAIEKDISYNKGYIQGQKDSLKSIDKIYS